MCSICVGAAAARCVLPAAGLVEAVAWRRPKKNDDRAVRIARALTRSRRLPVVRSVMRRRVRASFNSSTRCRSRARTRANRGPGAWVRRWTRGGRSVMGLVRRFGGWPCRGVKPSRACAGRATGVWSIGALLYGRATFATLTLGRRLARRAISGSRLSCRTTSTCTAGPTDDRSPRTAPTTPTPPQGPRPRRDGPRPHGRPRRRAGPGHRRASVGLLGPRAGEQSLIGDWVIPPALAGKTASVMGNPDMPHTYTFIPDIGENLVRLGEIDEALGRVCTSEPRDAHDARDDRTRLPGHQYHAAAQGHTRMADARTGARRRTVREINEMSYEFDEPFIVDASRAETELGLHATPLADAVDQTVRWYRARATPSSSPSPNPTQHVAPGLGSNR